MAQIRILEDTLTPATRRLSSLFAPAGRVEMLEALGLEFRAMTVESFQSIADRPAPWPAKKDGTASNLVESTTLRQSFQVDTGPSESKVSSSAVYAAAHQFGVTGRNLPARPFMPILSGELTGSARRRMQAIGHDKLRSMLRRATV